MESLCEGAWHVNQLGLCCPLQREVSWDTVLFEIQRCDRAESSDASVPVPVGLLLYDSCAALDWLKQSANLF